MLRTINSQHRRPKGIIARVISTALKIDNSYAYQKLLNNLKIRNGDEIFEIGYGHGFGIEQIQIKNYYFVSGIEHSELMFNEARQRNKKYLELNRCQLFLGDFFSFELNQSKYDKIFRTNIIYSWRNLEKPFFKIRKGLKKNGVFLFFIVPFENFNKMTITHDDVLYEYSIEQVIEALKFVGFSNITCEYSNGYFVRCKKISIK